MREGLYLLGPTAPNSGYSKWFESDEGDARLRQDRLSIREHYPELRYVLHYPTKSVRIQGQIILVEEKSRVPARIQIKIVLPDNYPKWEPMTFDFSGKFEHVADRHFYRDGMCCLWLPPESEWKAGDSATLLNYLNQVAVFFERQLIFDANGRWAWGERGHGIKGYLEMFEEMLQCDREKISLFFPLIVDDQHLNGIEKCPCGSRLNYRQCHRKRVNLIKEMLNQTKNRSAVNA